LHRKTGRMRTTANKYQDRNQNEVLLATSDTLFPTHFLQKKRQSVSFVFRSNHNVSPYNHPFTFTGKERDEETGFSYFGARYYDSDLSGLFMSVDPMADKYLSISSYAYCVWNPLSLVDPDGKDVYRLDTETGSLVLYERNNNKYDIIEAGTISGIGRAKGFKVSSTKKFSKGILNGEYGQDISQTGFVTYSNKQEEALDVAVFISFSCYKELSGVGYEGLIGNNDLEVFAWANNTSYRSDNPVIFRPSKGGKPSFHFHTHCGDRKGKGGYDYPGIEDRNTAATLKKTSSINTFVLISRKKETILYDENGRIPYGVRLLPESLHLKY